ncbi:unnamed protein product [Rotaria socialis]
MAILVPRGYGGFPSYPFSSPNQIANRNYYHDRNTSQGAYFSPHYPTQTFYQPPYYQDRQAGYGNRLSNFLTGLDERYRYEQYMRKLGKIERQYAKLHGYNAQLPMYPSSFETSNYHNDPVYEYEREIRYVPMPLFMNSTSIGFGTSSNFNYEPTSNMSLPPKIRVIFIPTGQSSLQQPCTGPLAMPPFLYNRISQPLCSFPLPPPLPQLGSLPLTPAVQQMVVQRYSNPVAVLPFSSNWQTPQMMMSSYPQASLYQQQPIPSISAFQSSSNAQQSYMPPLMPACSSLPPASNLQMLPSAPMQSFPSLQPASNLQMLPSAPMQSFPSLQPASNLQMLPSAPMQNYSSFQPASNLQMLPSAPMQDFSSLPPASNLQMLPSAPMQNYSSFQPASNLQMLPSAPMQDFSSLPPASNLQMLPSAPMQDFSSAATALSSAPISAFPSQQPDLQSYAASAPMMPANMPASSPPYDTAASSLSQNNFNNSYPSTCRACPPVPPSLNVPVMGYCWVQHCAACHRVPTPVSTPNARPASGRITPLLRRPTVPQYIPNQTTQQNQYLQAPTSDLMRPWLRKTPPLPPGAILISDEIICKDDYSARYNHSPRKYRRHHRSIRHKHRSTTVSSGTISTTSPAVVKVGRSVSPKRKSKNNSNQTRHTVSNKSNSQVSKTPSSDLTVEYQKVTLHSSKDKENTLPQQLAGEARNVNIKYRYQPQELPSVYLLNRYLKSSSEASTLASNMQASSDCSSTPIKEHSSTSSPLMDSISTQEEPISEKEDEKSIPLPSQSVKTKERVIIIRQYIASSPSASSTISSNSAFSIIKEDKETISKAS